MKGWRDEGMEGEKDGGREGLGRRDRGMDTGDKKKERFIVNGSKENRLM